MTSAELFYLSPFIISIAISSGVFLYAWRRRETQGSGTFAWYFASQTIWTLAYLSELFSPNAGAKIFWDSMEWLASALAIVAFPAFAIQYTKREIKNPRSIFMLSLVIPIVFMLLVFSDTILHLVRINPHLDNNFIFAEVIYRYTPIAIDTLSTAFL